jgi:methionyl-tRNA formyltransferase
MDKIRTIFLGSDWESLETLKALNEDSRFEIIAVITPPDKPVGRKQIMTPSKVKEYALENNIDVFHTEKQKERYQEALDKYDPELVVCKAFGEIVPEFFLEYPKYKSINVHFSILPKYRGAIPIQKALLDGEKKTGISVMLMSAGLDEGDVLEIFEEDILDTDTNLLLRERLVKKSADILGDVLIKWVEGKITPVPQDDSLATYCWQKEISKENAEIDWNSMDMEYIERMVRAMQPWPIAWTMLNMNEDEKLQNKRLKIFKSEIEELDKEDLGRLYSHNGNVYIQGKDGKSLRILELQLEGKNKTDYKQFLNGFLNGVR